MKQKLFKLKLLWYLLTHDNLDKGVIDSIRLLEDYYTINNIKKNRKVKKFKVKLNSLLTEGEMDAIVKRTQEANKH